MRTLSLILALVCTLAAGVSGTRYFDIRQARAQASAQAVLDAGTPVAVIELAHCDELVGALAVARDGHIWQIPSGDVMNELESVIPKEHKGRAIVKGGCDTQT